MGLHSLGRYDESTVTGARDQVNRRRVAQVKLHGIVIYYFNLFYCAPNVGSTLLQFDRPVDGKLDCLSVHLGAIVELDTLPQLEGPDQAIGTLLILCGQQGLELVLQWVILHQGLIDIVQNHNPVGKFHAGVPVKDWLTIVGIEGDLGLGTGLFSRPTTGEYY